MMKLFNRYSPFIAVLILAIVVLFSIGRLAKADHDLTAECITQTKAIELSRANGADHNHLDLTRAEALAVASEIDRIRGMGNFFYGAWEADLSWNYMLFFQKGPVTYALFMGPECYREHYAQLPTVLVLQALNSIEASNGN